MAGQYQANPLKSFLMLSAVVAHIPDDNAEYLRSKGVSERALEIHAQISPLDLHLDSLMVSWLFGIDLRVNQRDSWKPRKRLLLHALFKLLFPQGQHQPLFNHADFPRMIEGGFSGACFSAHTLGNNLYPRLGNPWRKVLEQYQLLTNLATEPGSPLAIAKSPDEFRRHAAPGRIVAIFSVEGVHCLGPVWPCTRNKRLGRLEKLRNEHGAAYVTVNHFSSNDVAVSSLSVLATNDPNQGTGPLAEELVATANRLGLILDLAHTNRQGILEIARMSSKPVIATHAGIFEIPEKINPGGRYNRRMLDRDSIKAIAATGGCIGVMFSPYFLHGKEKDGSLDLVVQHCNHLKHEVGYEHVCLGTDFDGALPSIPLEMRDAADLPLFTQKLLETGWVEREIKAMYCENFLRVWEENLRTS